MHDVLIIGAGPAGLAAALWCDELGLDTLVLEQADTVGGQLLSIYNPIENYPGVSVKNGREFLGLLSPKLEAADFDLWTGTTIESVDLKAKRIALQSGEELQSISIIIASGVRRRKLGIPGESAARIYRADGGPSQHHHFSRVACDKNPGRDASGSSRDLAQGFVETISDGGARCAGAHRR